ncbi:MAG: glycosyltransferase [Gemmatimonadaceae bacterium]
MNQDPLVSVIVVTYNSAREVVACLDAVAEHAAVPHELIVVDNASSDDTVAAVRRHHPGACIITNDDNAGFSRANNQGIGVAHGEYTLFLNPDTELRADALPRMLNVLKGGRAYSGVGPRLVNSDGQVWRVSARRLPTLWSEFCQRTALDRIFRRSPLFAQKWYEPWDRENDRDVECLTGAALLCRTTDLVALHGFDESVPLFLDDIDLCRRLLDLGRLRYVNGAIVLHHHDISGAQQPNSLIVRLGLQATYRYFDKHEGRARASLFAGVVFSLGIVAGALSFALAILGRTSAAARERQRARTFVGWALGSKSGPWVLPQRPITSGRRSRQGLFPNLG